MSFYRRRAIQHFAAGTERSIILAMPFNLRFAFICQRKWQELTGDDPVRRFCDSCDREIVNLDPLTDAEREKVFRDAIRTGTKPCVFATVPAENGTPCGNPRGTLLDAAGAATDEDFVELGGEPDDVYFEDIDECDDEVDLNDVEIRLEEG
jgi:hypothetical protein